MSENKKLVPIRRFKEFKNSNDWVQRKLDEVCKINGRIGFRGYTEKDIITKESGGVLTYSPTNIINNQLTTNCKNTYITRNKYEESPEIMISNGDILFVKTGSTLGKSALVTGLSEDATLNPQVVVMRVKKETEPFVSAMLTTEGVLKQVASAKIGGAVPTLTETQIKLFNIYEPVSDLEKVKIGNFFEHLDNLITLHQRKLEKMKALKAAYLSEMFPTEGERKPKRRFKGFTNAWEQRKLGELSDSTYGGGTPRTSNDSYWNGEIPWIQSSDLTEHQIYNVQPRKYISESGLSNSATKLIPENSIAIVTRVGVGKLAVMPFPYTTSQDFLSLSRLNTDVCFTAYLLYKKLQAELNSVQGTSIKGITKEELLAKTVLVPEHSEQVKIGRFFHNLDNLITLHQRKLEKLQNIKTAYLNEMFVGGK